MKLNTPFKDRQQSIRPILEKLQYIENWYIHDIIYHVYYTIEKLIL